jgi:hypothetical protein
LLVPVNIINNKKILLYHDLIKIVLQDNWRSFLHFFSFSCYDNENEGSLLIFWAQSLMFVMGGFTKGSVKKNLFEFCNSFLIVKLFGIKGKKEKKSATDLLLRDRCYGIMYWIWFNFKVAEYFRMCKEGLCSLNQTNALHIIYIFAMEKDLEFCGGVKSWIRSISCCLFFDSLE